MRKYILCCICLLFILGQTNAVEIRSRQLTTADGIANNTVRCMYQDSKGFIWMGTMNGLSRYDGNTFVTYRPAPSASLSLCDHRISSLQEDNNGFLWISSHVERYSCYDLKQERFVDFTGCGEYNELYSDLLIDRQGNAWLWHDGNGCRRVNYVNGKFVSTIFKESQKNLVSDKVAYVYEDEQGIVWIGTNKGVMKVEGDNTELILPSHQAIATCSEDGIDYFLSVDGQLEAWQQGKRESVGSLSNSSIKVLNELKLPGLWVIFTDKGGYEVDLRTWRISRSTRLDILNAQVVKDNWGNGWVSNHTGKIWRADAISGDIRQFTLMPPEKVKYVDEERYHIVCDSRGFVWISTYGNGLFLYDIREEAMHHFAFETEGTSHVTSDYLLYVMEDRRGGIWVSSEYAGVSHIQLSGESAQRLLPEPEMRAGRFNTIRMINKTADGTIWIGTRQGGLYTYQPQSQTLKKEATYDTNVYAVAQDKDNRLWIGTRGAGLNIDGEWYRQHPADTTSLGANNIFDLLYDRRGRMWIGTFGGGLCLAKPTDEGRRYSFRRFLNNSYAQSQIRVLEEDANGWIWAGTSAGVYVFHPDSLIMDKSAYFAFNMASGQLPSNEIKCLFCDSKDRMWIGTSGKGLSLCELGTDYKDLHFTYFDVSDGLVNNMVQSITEDRTGKIWIATELGISCFDPDSHSFENLFFAPNTLGNAYSENSCAQTDDGRLLFGSNYGLFAINPEEAVSDNPEAPVVSFTGLYINGILVSPGEPDSPLSRSMAYTNKIKLNHKQNSFVVNFSTFDYPLSDATKYMYRLDRYDKDWSVPSPLNFATYKNLDPGHYKLHVRACNRHGVWSAKEAVLDIVVTPPFWLTNWAFMLYALLIAMALYVTFRLVRNFNMLRNRIEVEKRLTEYKLVFFTNISHEFRTPLTLIQGALEKIKETKRWPKESKHALQVMDKSTQRMLRLINQLLELRKMQNNKLALSLEEADVVAFLRDIYQNFTDTAESKKMDFHFITSVDSYMMFVDKGYLDKITYNLLSNAFKYTPSGGKVTFSVSVDEKQKKLILKVTDTGVGIPKEKQGELFKRFMQSSFSGSSMGVGLHLSHELAVKHKGSISYAENVEGGSIFTVVLPTDSSVYETKDFLVPHNILLKEEEEEKQKQNALSDEFKHYEELFTQKEALTQYKMLIIEDDNDVRDFLKEEASHYFEVVTEAEGKTGLERAKTYDADLIVCDVLMPGMDGFEVTRRLKKDFNTSHIPVILLTAMSSDENRLEGIESGADAYITKPFSPKLLLATAFKLIEQRRKLRAKYSKTPDMTDPIVSSSSGDRAFATRLQAVVEAHIGDSAFSVDTFAAEMGLGRTAFYRKVRGLTGYTPNEYIRVVRLKKAASLLLEGKYTVSEISYRIGISDPFYFSKSFKQHFGVSPSAYKGNPGVVAKEE